MGAALKIQPREDINRESIGKSTKEKVENTLTEELFFSICAPIGSMKDEVIEQIVLKIKTIFNYEVEIIKLSDYIDIHKVEDFVSLPGEKEIFSKLKFKISQGDKIREKYNNPSILAELAIQEIHLSRTEETRIKEPQPEDFKSRRKCYIFNSIKNKEELLLLRQVYTDNFFSFSVFSPLEERKINLRKKDLSDSDIEEIIKIDEFENGDYGQNVRGSFTDGDFFLRVSEDNLEKLDDKIERFLHLIFESKIITPTIEEFSMYNAKSVSGNSSCLSRQVGACITDEMGNLVSTGWNDVPKFGGNLYIESSIPDHRCFNDGGYCRNDKQKDILVNGIIDSIKEDNELLDCFRDEDGVLNLMLLDKIKVKIKNSRIKDLIEFSRAVHAEMHAIILGSQSSGIKMINGKLFCTTYPCHNCARHIILSGIKEIYYIEPYIKSLCLTLHNDAITENEKDDKKVKLLIFDGVAPRKFLTFFTNFAPRKTNGNLEEKKLKQVKPKVAKSLQALPTLERQAIHSLYECGIIEKPEDEKQIKN